MKESSKKSYLCTQQPIAQKPENEYPRFPFNSGYVYCNGNPIKYVDPDGRKVEADDDSQRNIKNTLTEQEAKYLKFNKDGKLDVNRLMRSKSTSDNMTALKALANSEIVYSFQVSDTDHKGDSFYDNAHEGGNYYRGLTEIPNAKSKPSPENNVHILVGKVLDEKQQVMTTAHEAYGHAYFYETSRDIETANHTYTAEYSTVWDEEFQMFIPESRRVPSNIALENQINMVVNQARYNYESRRKN